MIEELTNTIKTKLSLLYGPRLAGVYLFGSYARGDYDAESDLDILIVLKDMNQYGKELDHTSEMLSELSIQYGITISVVLVQESEWIKAEQPFIANVQAEVVGL